MAMSLFLGEWTTAKGTTRFRRCGRSRFDKERCPSANKYGTQYLGRNLDDRSTLYALL